jgi:hypothetical protein
MARGTVLKSFKAEQKGVGLSELLTDVCKRD